MSGTGLAMNRRSFLALPSVRRSSGAIALTSAALWTFGSVAHAGTVPHDPTVARGEHIARLVCSTCGSPYYNPHIQRPAAFPPSDGYQPPEDPLIPVARQINTTARLKERFPDLAIVGSGYSYLQEWLPNVGQRAVRDGRVDFVGLGRMVLAYPELPADVLAGRPLARKRICRTFSDCTTAPRNGLVSGCYPLDPYYKGRPETVELSRIKQGE